MTERRQVKYRYKAVQVAAGEDAINAAIEEWTSDGWEVFETHPAIPAEKVGVIIFRREKR